MWKLELFSSFGLLISLFVISSVHVNGAKRNLSAQLNPDCPTSICESESEDEKITLVHVQADGDNDTLHYIWDLTRQPTVLVALCDRNTNVTVNWNKTFKDVDKIQFTPKPPMYTMSFVLTKVFIFNDIKDQASIIGVNTSYIETIDMKYLTWTRDNYTESTGEVKVAVSGKNDSLIGCDGLINLKLKCYGEEDHDSDIPHLLHSMNVTQVDIEFLNLYSNKTFGSPRVAAEFVLIASESPKSPFTITKRKTVDDEYTPGTFTLVDIITPGGNNGTQGSYLQFRPISYTEDSRDITTKTDIHLNEPIFIEDATSYLNSSLAYSYYGNTLGNNLVQSFNVSFGQPQDKFYSHTNYTTWTFVLGYGTAPPERVSMFIAILACIGLGIPLLLLIIGGVYLAVKRMRNC